MLNLVEAGEKYILFLYFYLEVVAFYAKKENMYIVGLRAVRIGTIFSPNLLDGVAAKQQQLADALIYW